LHRHWFEHSALRDLLGADDGLADIHKLKWFNRYVQPS
jgi:hypothetical protein